MIISKPKVSQEEFINRSERVAYPIKGVGKLGIPVGLHLMLVNGYYIYIRQLKKPLLQVAFADATVAYAVAKAIDTTYGEYLEIINDPNWSDYFFDILRHTIKDGKKFADFISKLDHLYPKKVLWDNVVDAIR